MRIDDLDSRRRVPLPKTRPHREYQTDEGKRKHLCERIPRDLVDIATLYEAQTHPVRYLMASGSLPPESAL
jgi:hypothetical protein